MSFAFHRLNTDLAPGEGGLEGGLGVWAESGNFFEREEDHAAGQESLIGKGATALLPEKKSLIRLLFGSVPIQPTATLQGLSLLTGKGLKTLHHLIKYT